jgi:hypothetical protein
MSRYAWEDGVKLTLTEKTHIATGLIKKAESECVSFESGKFSEREQAITFHDFTGDG